ncbi:MAG: metallophosphoesterase [Lentisphaeria bacterium]|nr:metallophosphoesterase [Lentisphaeria bacterium]
MRKTFSLIVLLACALLPAGESYAFYVISDTHFAPAETYNTAPGTKFRFRGKVDRTVQVLPAYENMFRYMAQNAGTDTKFLIHCGDIVDGFAKGEAEHGQQLQFAVDLLKKHFSFPIYYTVGNHDGYGLGGMAALRAVLLPEMARTLGREKLPFGNYTVTVGDDLFIFTDYYRQAKGPQFIKDTLKALEKKPRHLFIIVHCPVIHLVKTDLVDLLAKYDAVVISGHVHRNYSLVYKKDGGSVTQVTVASGLPQNPVWMRAVVTSTDLGTYKKYISEQAQKLGGKKAPLIMADWERELEPYLGNHIARRGTGYAKIHVSDAGVRLEYQGANTQTPPLFTDLVKKQGTSSPSTK